jgi:hypothetical protein
MYSKENDYFLGIATRNIKSNFGKVPRAVLVQCQCCSIEISVLSESILNYDCYSWIIPKRLNVEGLVPSLWHYPEEVRSLGPRTWIVYWDPRPFFTFFYFSAILRWTGHLCYMFLLCVPPQNLSNRSKWP